MNILISKPVLTTFLVVFFTQSAAIIGYFFLDSDDVDVTTSAETKVELIANQHDQARPSLKLSTVDSDKTNKNDNTVKELIAKNEEPKAEPLTAEQIAIQQEAANNANSLFDNAFVTGKWEQKDTFALLQHLGDLSEEDTYLLSERFHTAFNAQELELESIPPL